MLRETTLRAATDAVCSTLPDAPPDADGGPAADGYTAKGGAVEWRLRHWSPMTGRPGQTFAQEMADSSLATILTSTALRERQLDLMLEVRTEGSRPFQDYNPNEFMVSITLWDAAQQQLSSTTLSVVVPGEQSATVGDLRAAAADAFGLERGQRFWLVCPTAGSSKLDVLVLGDKYDNQPDEVTADEQEEDTAMRRANCAQQLRRDHKIWSGEKLFIERALGSEDTGGSTCAEYFEREAYFVTLSFNCVGSNEFDHNLPVDLRSTILDAKASIAGILGLELESFHLRRGERSPMIKNEDSTLQDLGFSEGSPLFVAAGRVLRDGEFLLKYVLYHEGTLSQLAAIPAAAEVTIKALKADVAEAVQSSTAESVVAAREGWEAGAARVRLRDCKGAEVGKVLQDRRKLKTALQRLADGREIAVQLLTEEESVSENDIILVL